MARILVVDDQEVTRESLTAALGKAGHDVTACCDGQVAVARLAAAGGAAGGGKYDLLIAPLKMAKMSGADLLQEAKRLRPDMPVLLVTAFATVRTAVEAMKLGAFDFIQKPYDCDELRLRVGRALEYSRLLKEAEAWRAAAETSTAAPRPLAGGGAAMEQVKRSIERAADGNQGNIAVLVRGETGTGKKAAARAVHAAGDRRDRPFLVVNCAALAENIQEGELFGYDKGALNGDARPRRGRFELADGGTLLFDEVGALGPAAQTRLLRALQENAFERGAGGGVTHHVDVRIIATTRRDLEQAAAEGRFRQDLLRRLGGVTIDMPPLRQRVEDIPELCRHFLHQLSKRECSPFRHIEAEAVRLMQRYTWPGNVRELQCVVERACLLETEPGVVRAATIEPWVRARVGAAAGVSSAAEELAGKPLADIEKQVILSTLQQFKGHRLKTAGALGIGVRTLGMKLKQWKERGELVDVRGF